MSDETPTCTVDGCTGKPVARGLCGTHHKRWQRHGDPLGGQPYRVPRSVVAGSLSDAILTALTTEARSLTAPQIATALIDAAPPDRDRPWWNQRIAAECNRMTRRGLLIRHRTVDKRVTFRPSRRPPTVVSEAPGNVTTT